jgi:hypothetical protein
VKSIQFIEDGEFALIPKYSVMKAIDTEMNRETFVIDLYEQVDLFNGTKLNEPMPIQRKGGVIRARMWDMGDPMKMAFAGNFDPTKHIEVELIEWSVF